MLLQTKGCARIMNVTTPEKRWTDERLDDLKETVEDGFARVDADIRELRGELRSEASAIRGELRSEVGDLRMEMNTRFVKVDERFDKLNERFDRQNWGLFAAAVAIIAAMLGPNVF